MKPQEGEQVVIRGENADKAAEVIAEVKKELEAGFKFLKKYPLSVTFFGSTEFEEGNQYYDSARTLAGRIVSELKYSVLSGGGPGIMEAADRGAREAGGNSLGVTINLPEGQVTNEYVTDKVDLYYFFVRKVCLSFSAEAFLFFPGGYGTLDEFFELVTLLQTRKITGVPLICIGSEYWNAVKEFMVKELLSRGTIKPTDLDLFVITDDHEEALRLIKESKPRGL
jgi:uncharacterized protein (TIGR00730 family)